MTLREYMNEHFFDSGNPYDIIEDGQKLDINWDQYDKYRYIRSETIDSTDFIFVEKI